MFSMRKLSELLPPQRYMDGRTIGFQRLRDAVQTIYDCRTKTLWSLYV